MQGIAKLYICRSDGKDLRRLTAIVGEQIEPSYSRALERVFFVSTVNKRKQIFSVDLKGKDLKQHTFGLTNSHQPDASPDGKKLAFASAQWGPEELAQLDLSTGQIDRLTYDKSLNLYPRYSPDGSKLVYISHSKGLPHLYLMDLSDNHSHRLIQTTFSEGPGRWHPQGRKIVATIRKPPARRNTLIEIDLDTDQVQPVLPDISDVAYPGYTTDGSRLFYVHQEKLYFYSPIGATSEFFPLQGKLGLESAEWIRVPLP